MKRPKNCEVIVFGACCYPLMHTEWLSSTLSSDAVGAYCVSESKSNMAGSS